jgi:hypothetical protein
MEKQGKPNRPYAGTSRRTGAAWKEFDDARGAAAIIPIRDGSPFRDWRCFRLSIRSDKAQRAL